MNIKICEYCNKELLIDNGDSNIVSFCDDSCLNDYCQKYVKDNSSDILNEMGGRYE